MTSSIYNDKIHIIEVNYGKNRYVSNINKNEILIEKLYRDNKLDDNKIIWFFALEANQVFEYISNNKFDLSVKMLFYIYFNPFILCNQKCIGSKLREALPSILMSRYVDELSELDSQYDLEYISSDEYLDIKKEINKIYLDKTDIDIKKLKKHKKRY